MMHVPEALEAAVLKALAREPDDRHPTAAAFSDALAGRGPKVEAAKPPAPGASPASRPTPPPEAATAKAGARGCFGSVLVLVASAAAGLLLS
jgi:serine/threonine-protein kinase